MARIACITGATAGIGKATALALAKEGYNVIITGRRSERLQQVSAEIALKTGKEVLPLTLDMRDQPAVEKAFTNLSDQWKNIEILINNAGLAAGLDFINEGSLDDWEAMIDTNIKGLLYATRAVSPGMVSRKKGHIVNISSIAGKEVYEKGNVYCGTKHAVDAITKGTRIDLLKHGIKVTSVSPGAVDTEFSSVRFKGDNEKADAVYQGYTPLYADDVADAVLFAVTRPPHVNINDLLIMPAAQASAAYLHREE